MKSLNLALSLTSLFVAAQASAMYYPYDEQGQLYWLDQDLDRNHFDAVDWSQHQSLVYTQCTAQIIAGKYLLTAGHCVPNNLLTPWKPPYYSEWQPEGAYSQVKTLLDDSNEDAPSVLYSFWHQPNQAATVYVDSRFVQFAIPTNGRDSSGNAENLEQEIRYDVAIFTLKEAYPHVKTAPFLESAPTQVGDDVHIFGARYLGDQYEDVTTRELRSGKAKLTPFSLNPSVVNTIRSDYNEKGIKLEEGDSGGMWLNNKDRIVALTSSGNGDYADRAALISDNTDFLLESINAWHSVTYADIAAGKQKTIELQNLHSNTLDLANTITKTGDVDIDDNQCANVAPFETCQITLSSVNGEAGVVTLEDGFNIYINDVPEHYKHPRTTPHTGTDPKQQPVQAPSQGGGGGGSLGIWSGLALFGLGLRRRLKRG